MSASNSLQIVIIFCSAFKCSTPNDEDKCHFDVILSISAIVSKIKTQASENFLSSNSFISENR